jgi:hypothetical protein
VLRFRIYQRSAQYPERKEVFEHWPLFFHKVCLLPSARALLPAHTPQTDKLGRPINIHRFGGINAPELNKLVGPERFDGILTVNCEALTREILPACAVAAGTRIETVLVIVDLKGFGCGRRRHGRLGASG